MIDPGCLERVNRGIMLTVVTLDSSAVSLLMWMVLPGWILDEHTVECRYSRNKLSTERRHTITVI